MMRVTPRITGRWREIVCLAAGAGLTLLLAADLPRDIPQVPDAGAQRARIEQELTALNAKMDELLRVLKSGNLKVVCVQADTNSRGMEHERPTPSPGSLPRPRATAPRGDAR